MHSMYREEVEQHKQGGDAAVTGLGANYAEDVTGTRS